MSMKNTSRYIPILFIAAVVIFSCTKTANNIPNPPQPPAPSPPIVKPVDSADAIYIAGGYTNDVYKINAQTGAVIWDKKVSGSLNTSAIYCNGRVVVKGRNMNITAFDTAGNIQWTYQMPGNTESPDDIALIAQGGKVYAEDLEHIYAIGINDGAVQWTYTKETHYDTLYYHNPNGSGTLILQGNKVYVNNSSGNLYALDTATGILQWESFTNAPLLAPVVYDKLIYFQTGYGIIWVIDANTGVTLSMLNDLSSVQINMKYGRIYDLNGTVRDSATAITTYTSVQYPTLNYLTDGAVYPILEDSLAIVPGAVCDAFTGQVLCNPDVAAGGLFNNGITYANHIVYYTTSQREYYDPYTGGHWYSDAYAYDVSAKKLLWHTQIENASFFNTEPCVVTRNKRVYRGAYSFK